MLYNFLFIITIVNILILASLSAIYLNWNNLALMFISMELINILIIYLYGISALIIDDFSIIIWAIFILVVAAVETVIGIIVLINFVNNSKTLNL